MGHITRLVKARNSIKVSKKAQELLSELNLKPSGLGSGKDGLLTIRDAKKQACEEFHCTPNALVYAIHLGIDLREVNGCGEGGQILLEDVEAYETLMQDHRQNEAGRNEHNNEEE